MTSENMGSQTDNSVLEDLIETLEDGANGFEQAADLLRDGEGAHPLASEMRDLAEQRRRFSAELREIAAKNGDPVEEAGSVGGAIHRAWMELKDGATGADSHAILAAAETGEDHAVSEYEDALDRDDLVGAAREAVIRQANSIRAAHDKVKGLRDGLAD